MSRRGIVAWLAALLTGCALIPTEKDSPTIFDLGAPQAYAKPSARFNGTLLIYEVEAPRWLDSTGIVYRLNYIDSSRQQLYATARWAASPPVLVTRKLQGMLAAAAGGGIVSVAGGARASYALRVELDDFSQLFDSPMASRAVIIARASLINISTRRLHAQNTFVVEQVASSADVNGGIRALGRATDELVETVAGWTAAALSATKD